MYVLGSSPEPSIPEELQHILNSDDSDKDPHFDVDEALSSSDSGEYDKPPKSRKTVQGVSSESNLIDESSDSEEGTNIPLTTRGRPRTRGLKGDSRKNRMARKVARNAGKGYKTLKGKIVESRKTMSLGHCRNRCAGKISKEKQEKLFSDYWVMGSFDRRLSFLSSLIDIKDKKTTRKRSTSGENGHFRQISVVYNIEVEGQRTTFCKTCFMTVFGESRRFIETVIQKKRFSASGIVQLDARGSHVPKNKKSEDEINTVKQFLNSLPAYESHYSRRDCEKKFLPSYMSLAELYVEYSRTCAPACTPVSRRLFETLFHEMNLAIKKPKIDTCATCDRLVLQIKTGNETANLQKQLDEHHKLAEIAYDAKKTDKLLSQSDKARKTITFDMQQCLPTPFVQSSVAFYKRQLWTYNLTVHDCDTGQAYCYLWHEGIAGRGANEVGSCVYRCLITDINPEIKNITMYSDTCGGQNKNSHVAVMCMVALQQSPYLQTIDHKFLLPGHTHMECDSDHSLIERKKKKYHGNIEHPHDWAQLIRQTGRRKPFIVKEMVREDFLDFAGLLTGQLLLRKMDTDGNVFNWRHVKWLHFDKNEPGILYYKTELDESDFKTVSFRRRGRSDLVLRPQLRYKSPNCITVEKKKDLMDLLQFVSPVFHQFYKELETSKSARNVHPDTIVEETDDVE